MKVSTNLPLAGVPRLSPEACKGYRQDGYVVVSGLLSEAEMAPLGAELDAHPERFHRVGPLDWIGWTQPGGDLAGALSRLERLVDAAETLLGEPCYHWHSKIARKPPGRELALDWHQDFGSWYKDGCLLPDLVTCVVAVTAANAANGGLRLKRGSHRLGRLDRLPEGVEDYSYFRLNPARLEAIEQRFETVTVEMAPGDALLFHPNTLHASGPNTTASPRTLLEITYNAVTNAPVFEHQQIHMPKPLVKVADASLPALGQGPVFGDTRLVDIADPDDPGMAIFRRRRDPGLC